MSDPIGTPRPGLDSIEFRLQRHCRRLLESLFRHRERYIKAWIAVTGIDPSEAELVEVREVQSGEYIQRLFVRRRLGAWAGKHVFVTIKGEDYILNLTALCGRCSKPFHAHDDPAADHFFEPDIAMVRR